MDAKLTRITVPYFGSIRVNRGLLVIAMRYVTFFALVQTLVYGFVLGEADSGQHPEEFRGTVTRSVEMKYLLFIPDGYGVIRLRSGL